MKSFLLLILLVFSSSAFSSSSTTNSAIGDVGISAIKLGRMYLAILWNFRAVLGLILVFGSIAYWYRLGNSSNEDTAMSSIWFPIAAGSIGAFMTYSGGIDYLGEIFTFSSGADALILHDGRANLTENAQYDFKQGSNTE